MSTNVVAFPIGENKYQIVSRHTSIPAAAKALGTAKADHPDAVVGQLVRGKLSITADLQRVLDAHAYCRSEGIDPVSGLPRQPRNSTGRTSKARVTYVAEYSSPFVDDGQVRRVAILASSPEQAEEVLRASQWDLGITAQTNLTPFDRITILTEREWLRREGCRSRNEWFTSHPESEHFGRLRAD